MNNVILDLNEIIKRLSSFEIILVQVFALHSTMKKPSLSERVKNPWKQLFDVHETQVSAERKNPSRGRVSGSRCKCIKQVHESSELKGVSRISIESIIVTALRTTDGR